MEDFLLKNYSFLTHLVEVTSAITGLFLFYKYKYSYAKYFIYFLIYLTICDFIGEYTKYVYPQKFLGFLKGTAFQKNHWFYTISWDVGAIMFFVFYYVKSLKTSLFKNIITYLGFSFFIFSFIYIGTHWDMFFNQFFLVIEILGAIVIFLCAIFYFIETLQTDKVLTFYKSLNFYISFTIFIWWLIITPITFYDMYFTYEVGIKERDWDFVFLRWQIYLFANTFMYSTFTFALIFCKPEYDITIEE